MAEISVAQTGLWSDTATWVGGVLPLVTDTISCLGGKTLTVDGDYACAGGLCATGSKIVIAPDKSFEITGLLTMGTSTLPRTSYLEFGAGSELKLTGANIQLWACGVTTNGTTKANPAKISGTGSVTASANSGKGYFDCQYLSWLLTGTVSVKWGNVASSFPQDSYYKFLNSTFGETSFDFGSNTIAVSQFIVNNCDFRESTCTFYFLGNSGLSQIRYSTFSAATRKAFTLRSGGATTDFTGTVFNNVTPSVQTKEAANLNFSGMFAALTSAPSGTSLISVDDSDTSGNGVYEDSYFYISTENLRVLSIGSAATTSKVGVAHTVERNVLELSVADGGNPIVVGPMRALIRLNLMIGYVLPWASRAYAVGATPYGIEVSRNTQVAPAGDIAPALVSFEQGAVAYPGDIDTHSNLTAWTVTPHADTYAALACERSSIVDDSLNLVGHNATFGAGSGSRYTYASLVTDLTANDVILPSAPTFVDPTRNLATWGAAQGADGTVQGAIDLLLAINGYDAATKTQNGTASGVTVPDLVSWVRAGYVPTTSALAGAGYLGVDIGALDVGSSDDISIPLTFSDTAPATLLGVQVWSKVPTQAEVEGLY